MKKILFAVCAIVVLWGATCVADGSLYKDTIDNMARKAEELVPYTNNSKLNCATYDKWYEEFKEISGEFAKTFVGTHKNRASFKLTSQAMDELASIWNTLKKAEEADEMYVECITGSSGEVSYAHSWKKTAATKRKEAQASITKGINLFKDAKTSLKDEPSE
jgi:hypothetical protein